MRWSLLFASTPLFVMGLCLWLTPIARGDELAQEMEKLQGTWVPVRAERLGFALDMEIKHLTVVIKGDKMTFKWPREVAFSFVLGSNKEHKTIDRTNLDGDLKGHVSLGIYSCEDNLLAICSSSSPRPVRPTAFSTAKPPEHPRSLYIFKRVQP